MMPEGALLPLLAAIGLALMAGPLGCFVVWRRMAYFGATLAHAALLGIAFSLLLDIDQNLGVLVVCLALSALLVALQTQTLVATDTLLGILAHGTLALGLVVIAFAPVGAAGGVDLEAYLFGDVLAVRGRDLAWIWGGGVVVLAALAAIWRRILFVTVHEELARVSGIDAAPVRLVFMLLVALVTAVAIKIVGIMLVVSLLIIPAAAARRFLVTPEGMAVLAAGIGCLSVAAGFGAWSAAGIPAGPAIVSAATLAFVLSLLVPSRGK